MTLDEVIVALTLKNLELEAALRRVREELTDANTASQRLGDYLKDIAEVVSYTGHYGNLYGVVVRKP